MLASAPAAAQFGSIFGDPPPRPPGTVPGGGGPINDDRYQPRIYQPDGLPPPPQPGWPPQPSPYPPQAARPFPGQQPYPGQQQPYPGQAPQPGQPPGVQSQPLPPPPGSAAAAPPAQAAPDARQPRGTPQPASTAPQPGDEVVTPPPSQRIENPTAIFSGLDKITGRITAFDVAIDETVQFGALQVTPRACYTRPATETPNTDAFLEVDEITLQGEVRRIYTGWMFAASPGLHAIEHPIYDVWLKDCKGGTAPTVTAEGTPEPAAAKPPPRPQRPQQQRPRQTLPPPPSQQFIR